MTNQLDKKELKKKDEIKDKRRESIDEFKKGFFSSSLLDKPFDLDFKFDFDENGKEIEREVTESIEN